MDAAFAAFARVHHLMSPHAAASDVARINHLPAGSEIRVDPWTACVLRASRHMEHASAGAFQVCFTTRRRGRVPPASLQLAGRRVLRPAGVRLDLGGIAKGHAVDRATAALVRGGAVAGRVNAGGDLRCFGTASQPLMVRHPRAPDRPVTVAAIRCGAAATSFFERGLAGLASQGLVDGRSGARVRAGLVTVLARDCMTADALTKVAALLGQRADALLAAHGAQALWLPQPTQHLQRQAA